MFFSFEKHFNFNRFFTAFVFFFKFSKVFGLRFLKRLENLTGIETCTNAKSGFSIKKEKQLTLVK